MPRLPNQVFDIGTLVMFRSFIRRFLLAGLTPEESPTLLQLSAGFCIRCFWFLIATTFVASACWCLAGTTWTTDKRDFWGNEFRLQTHSIIFDQSADVSRLPPSQQATFWKQKTSELADVDLDADELMAVAIVLNEPAFGYASQWMTTQLLDGGNIFEVMEEAAIEYRNQLSGLSSEFAARAVHNEPDNAELRRIQAMLLFPYSYGSEKLKHCKNPNWLRILRASKLHDRDNALYDYLIAAHAWKQSTDIVFKSDPFMSCEVVNNQALYELAAKHFEAGQSCQALRFPNSEMILVRQLCRRLGLQREASRIACSSEFELDSFAILRCINHQLSTHAESAQLVGDPEHFTEIAFQKRRIVEQLERDINGSIGMSAGVSTAQSEAMLRRVRLAHPELVANVSPKTREQVNFKSKMDHQVTTETSLRLLRKLNVDSARKDDGSSIANAVRPIIYGILLLFISASTYLLQRRILRQKVPYKIGQLTCGCFLISVVGWTVVLALLPSGLVKGEVPGAAFIIGAELLIIGGLIWLVRKFWIRRHKLTMPVPVRLRFILPFVVLFVLFLQAVLWGIKFWIDDQFRPQESGFATLPIPTNQSLPAWAKAIAYWEHNHILAISLVTGTLLTTGFVSRLSWRWKMKTRASLRSSIKYFCGSCCAAFQRPALAAALILCSIGFATTPSAIDYTLAWEQYRELWCDRDARKDMESTIRAQVLRDPQFMNAAETVAVAYSRRIPDDMEDCYLRANPVLLNSDEGGYPGGL